MKSKWSETLALNRADRAEVERDMALNRAAEAEAENARLRETLRRLEEN